MTTDTDTYAVWIKGQVGRVSPSPNFKGTKAEAEALLKQLEQDNPGLEGELVVGPRE